MGDVSQLTPAVAEPAAGAAAAAHAGPRRFFARLVREQPLGTAGGVVILLLVLVSIFADSLAPYRYEEIHLRDRLQAPRPRTCWAPTTSGGTCSAASSTGHGCR